MVGLKILTGNIVFCGFFDKADWSSEACCTIPLMDVVLVDWSAGGCCTIPLMDVVLVDWSAGACCTIPLMEVVLVDWSAGADQVCSSQSYTNM